MPRIPYLIGELLYPTKKAAQEAIRAVLYKYQPGQTLDPSDSEFISGVLANHPEVDSKVGCGVQSFQVEDNGGTQGFWLTRTDGTRTDFSFVSCLTHPTPEKEARAGFRTEIRDQIVEFRDASFARQLLIACAITGQPLTATTAHVDHAEPTFYDLVDRFVSELRLDIAGVKVLPTQDGSTETRLADLALAAAWRDYHRAHARLRIVSRQANLSLLRRKTRTS